MGLDLAQVPYTKTALTALDKGAQRAKADLANNPQQKRLWGPASQLRADQNEASPPQLRVTSGIGVLARGVTGQGGG